MRVIPWRAMHSSAAVRMRASTVAVVRGRTGASLIEIDPITVRHYATNCLRVYAYRT